MHFAYRPEYIATWLGLSKNGVVSALINFHLRHEPLLHCIRQSKARAVVIGKELLPAYLEIRDQLGDIPAYVVGAESEEDMPTLLNGKVAFDGCLDFDVLLPRMPTSNPPVRCFLLTRD